MAKRKAKGAGTTKTTAPATPRILFMVTYGRTGSTLLQGLLNACPRTLMLGENWGVLYGLHQLRASLQQWRDHAGMVSIDAPTHPFFGGPRFDFDGFDAKLADLGRSYFEHFDVDLTDYDVIGFKDTKYIVPDLDAHLEALAALFPNALFLFLTRDHDELVGSGFLKLAPEDMVREALANFEQTIDQLEADLGAERIARLDYRDVVERGPKLFDLFHRLGLQPDPAALEAVAEAPHSYDQRRVVPVGPGAVFRPDLDALSDRFLSPWLDYRRAGPGQVALRSFAMGGVLLPKDAEDRLLAICWRDADAPPPKPGALAGKADPTSGRPAELGLPTRAFHEGHPDRSDAATAGFAFEPNDHPRLDHPHRKALWVETARRGPLRLGVLTVVPDALAAFPQSQ